MLTLGVAIITHNEERIIESCLNSIAFADDIVVVDSGSTDRTKEIVESKNVRFIYNPWPGFPKQKQYAVDQLNTDVIFVLDADEVVTNECKDELKKMLHNGLEYNGYMIPRYHYFWGKIMYHGKGIDFPIRIFKKSMGHFNDREVHEKIIIDGNVGTLEKGIIHYSSPNIIERFKKMERDSNLETNCDDGIHHIGLNKFVFTPISYFFYNLIIRKGYRDGIRGIIWLTLFSLEIIYQNYIVLRNRIRKQKP